MLRLPYFWANLKTITFKLSRTKFHAWKFQANTLIQSMQIMGEINGATRPQSTIIVIECVLP